MTGPIRSAYDRLVEAGELKRDPAQLRAVAALDRLSSRRGCRGGFPSLLFGTRAPAPAGV
jgi:predicted ATPase